MRGNDETPFDNVDHGADEWAPIPFAFIVPRFETEMRSEAMRWMWSMVASLSPEQMLAAYGFDDDPVLVELEGGARVVLGASDGSN